MSTSGCGSIFQGLASSRTTDQTFLEFSSDFALEQASKSQEKLHCLHPECRGSARTYSREAELKRHEKEHNSNAPVWRCGCCQNQGKFYEGSKRKDKVREHLMKKHYIWKPEGQVPEISCSEIGCHTLLTAATCLYEHLRVKHPDTRMGVLSSSINGI